MTFKHTTVIPRRCAPEREAWRRVQCQHHRQAEDGARACGHGLCHRGSETTTKSMTARRAAV